MANKQQTAVEWLFSQLPDHLRLSRNGFDMKQQALQMEREQIVSAVHYGIRSPYTNIQTIHPQVEMTKGEQYYNDTYGTDKN